MQRIKSRREQKLTCKPTKCLQVRSEETPRPAKKPRRKAGIRAKRGVSELCHVNTMDQLSDLKHKPAIQRSDCGFERRKTFAVEMNALARSSDIQRSFLSVSCEHYGSMVYFLDLSVPSVTLSTLSIRFVTT